MLKHSTSTNQVYHSAWRELCEGMAGAGSFDEVIEVHEAYLLSIQRKFSVVPDKLSDKQYTWTRAGLLFGSADIIQWWNSFSAIKARCEKEVDRIEKQFDDCMAFLLRVGFYPSSLIWLRRCQCEDDIANEDPMFFCHASNDHVSIGKLMDLIPLLEFCFGTCCHGHETITRSG
ncbi:gamma-tubulin complex component 5-like protein isoform X4 [Tanacetum coccineum]